MLRLSSLINASAKHVDIPALVFILDLVSRLLLFLKSCISFLFFFSLHPDRFTLAPELHPDWMLLLFFTHTHLTVTVTLGLLLIPKVNLTSHVSHVTLLS